MAFFHCDIDTGVHWKPGLEAMHRILQQRHIPFGLIYTGGYGPATDAEWVSEIEGYFADYETHGGAIPDEVIFQSWQPFPKHILPETDPTTFTHVVNRYFRERTSLTSTIDASSIWGTLSARDTDQAVANAPIVVTAAPRTGTGQQVTYTRSGTIPPGTAHTTFGVRVNSECGLTAPADFSVSSFTMDAGAAGTLGADFTQALNGWGWWGDASVVEVINSTLHVQTLSGEDFGLNHEPQPFDAEGTPFTFSVNASIPTNSGGNACLILVFQTADFREIRRVSIPLQPQPVELGTATAAADGSFVLGLVPVPSSDYVVWAQYPGSDLLWPAASSHALGNTPALGIATASLPPGSAGSSYSNMLAASDGHAPYIWLASGLPPGLALGSDGTLSGTATAHGDYDVSIVVIDDSTPLQVAEKSFRLAIQ